MLKLSISQSIGKSMGRVEPLAITWADFTARLSRTTYTTETVAEYEASTKKQKTNIKNVGGYVGATFREKTREKKSLVSASVLSLDFDKDVSLSDVWGAFCLLELTGHVYTTHSHREGCDRFRIVMPLSRPVSAAEYTVVGKEAISLLGSPTTDEGSYQPERLMFWPSTSKDGVFIFHSVEGEALNVDEILQAVPPALVKEPEDPTTKKGLMGAFCRTYSVVEAIEAFIPDEYEVYDGRCGTYYTYRAGSTAGGLFVYPSDRHAYSHHSTDPANTGHAVNAFDLVRLHKFGELDKKTKPNTPLMKRPSFKAMCELAIENPEVKEEMKREQRDRASNDYDEIEAIAVARGNESYQKIISELLKQIEWVDFREKAELKEDATIPRKTYVTIAVDQLLITAVSNKWGLCTKNGFIYVYNGSYWQVIDADDFRQFLAKAAIKMGVPVLDAKYHLFKDELYKQFLSEAGLPTPEIKQSTLINLINGTFEISEAGQKLREPRREDFIKHQLPFEYDPDAVCPIFDAFLTEVQPDEDCRKVLAEYVGYVFTRNLSLEKLLVLYGGGANGKSVFFNVVRALLGHENVCSYSLSELTRPDSWQRAELGNNLLNYTSEIDVKIENAIFKQLVSGEAVSAQRKYQDPFTMTDYAKLIVNGNLLPRASELTEGYFRRFLIVPFNVTIPEDRRDPELAKKIISNELSGVFNWVLSGLRRVLANKGFSKSDAIKTQIEAYRTESDSVSLFMDEEGYGPDVNNRIPLKDIYDEYVSYCYDNGYVRVSNKEMRKRLEKIGYYIKRESPGRFLYTSKKNFFQTT